MGQPQVQKIRGELGLQEYLDKVVEETAAKAELSGYLGGCFGGRPRKKPSELRGVLGGAKSNRLQPGQTRRRMEMPMQA